VIAILQLACPPPPSIFPPISCHQEGANPLLQHTLPAALVATPTWLHPSISRRSYPPPPSLHCPQLLDAASRIATSGATLSATAKANMLSTAASIVRQLPRMPAAVNTSTALLEVLSAGMECGSGLSSPQPPSVADALLANAQATAITEAVAHMLAAAALPGHGLIADAVCVSVAAIKRPLVQLDSYQMPVGNTVAAAAGSLDMVNMQRTRASRVLSQAQISLSIAAGSTSVVVLPSYLSASCGAEAGASCPLTLSVSATYYNSADAFTSIFPAQLLPTAAITNITSVTGVLTFDLPDWPASDVGVCDSTESVSGRCDMHVLLPASSNFVASRSTACLMLEEGVLKGFPKQPGISFVGERQ
jgi:hypothetical protein